MDARWIDLVPVAWDTCAPGMCDSVRCFLMACRALSSVLLSSIIAVVFAGCDEAPLVTAPNAPTSQASSPADGTWNVDSTIVKADGSCLSGVSVGRTFSSAWSIDVAGSAIWLDESVQNAPSDDTRYEGTVDHLQFTATQVEPPLNPVNPVTPAPRCSGLNSLTFSGTFNSTFTAFEATQTRTFKSGPDLETQTLESHLAGARR